MLALVRRARRRLMVNEALSQGATVGSATLLVFIFLLLTGTQVLSWRWLVPVPLAAVAFAAWRVLRRLPKHYSVAQLVDRRLNLADTLSTALHFASLAPAKDAEAAEVRRIQLERAQRLSETLDARKAVPFVMPGAVYALAALLLVASSLFALRYGLNRRLDLRPPLARILHETFGGKEPQIARAAEKTPPKPADPQRQDDGRSAADDTRDSGGRQDEQASAPEDSKTPEAGKPDANKNGAGAPKPDEKGQKADSEQSEGESADRQEDSNNNSGDQQGNNKSDQKQNASNRSDSNSGDNSSLISKVKDAMQNLLSRMKPQPGQQGGQQQASMDQKGAQGKGQQSGQRQQASKDGQPQNGKQSESQDGQAGEQAQNAQDSQGKGTGKSDSQQASKQPGSGIGSQDGDKSIRQAEQLAAMGKISEILGKRSQTITGESSVEVQNTSQQLHTPYAQRVSQHSQGGAEINRDEVPVALQAYVEQYFEQVRKQAAATKK